MSGITIQVNGVVQGVGFRPTVWSLANQLELTGSVWNGADGVTIELWGEAAALKQFVSDLQTTPPPLAIINEITTAPLAGDAPEGFTIIPSQGGHITTGVAADAATCPDCLEDIRNPKNRRYRYPFTNCTHCGPRLSIIHTIPYDRPNTSMAPFTMCPDCQQEYEDPADRRFHAQPNCCPVCGPRLWIEDSEGNTLSGDPITQTAQQLLDGKIVAIKGIGGFHLACDATHEAAIQRLRQRKRRPTKALAVMVTNLEEAHRYVTLNTAESEALQSRAAPIVVAAIGGEALAPSLSPLHPTLGIMLPYSPLHHLLMETVGRPIVLTSGNRSGEPQCITNETARNDLQGIADYWLLHDREIINRVDDSVVREMGGNIRTLRHGRGYAPESRALPEGFEESPDLLAMGGELKNSFALLHQGRITSAQYIGDLKGQSNFEAYRNTHQLYQQLFDHHPQQIVIDQHPDYLSTQLGATWARERELSLAAVQHHHAHIAAVMVEHQIPRTTPPLLGIALDGLGYGDHGEIWGGEFLLADYCHYQRLGRFVPTAMIGGSKASLEPWRNLVAHLFAAIGHERLLEQYGDLELTHALQQKPLTTLQQMIEQRLNSPLASSAGRLVDAVAAALNLHREQISFEGEAAIALEGLATQTSDSSAEGYPYRLELVDGLLQLSWEPLWEALLKDLQTGLSAPNIALRFHHGLSDAIAAVANRLCQQHSLDTVALGGGVFQNRLLLEGVTERLQQAGFIVLSANHIPANDQGIAMGQCAIAAAQPLTPRSL